ncbi:MAG: deoxynucleoside kinase [Bacteroidetes bacterium 4572_128]|nr:MAG: deoxynucleoside kinase [Bacteroidetes bacterium 4572_128]
MHIAIAGNIGSGKTTLSRLLAEHYNWETRYESVENNPYLNDFYNDMKKWSFNLQIYFLNSRFNQLIEIKNSKKNVIQDRTIYEDVNVFAPNLHSMRLISSRDFDTYYTTFNLMSSLIRPPDLLIYLQTSVEKLLLQIKKRGRNYEKNIRFEYLKNLNDRYETWIENYKHGKLLVINVNNLDFENRKNDFQNIIKRIDQNL